MENEEGGGGGARKRRGWVVGRLGGDGVAGSRSRTGQRLRVLTGAAPSTVMAPFAGRVLTLYRTFNGSKRDNNSTPCATSTVSRTIGGLVVFRALTPVAKRSSR